MAKNFQMSSIEERFYAVSGSAATFVRYKHRVIGCVTIIAVYMDPAGLAEDTDAMTSEVEEWCRWVKANTKDIILAGGDWNDKAKRLNLGDIGLVKTSGQTRGNADLDFAWHDPALKFFIEAPLGVGFRRSFDHEIVRLQMQIPRLTRKDIKINKRKLDSYVLDKIGNEIANTDILEVLGDNLQIDHVEEMLSNT